MKDLSYSAIMRKLRKGDDDRRLAFQKTFKKVFDAAICQKLENPDKLALMAAVKEIGFK